MEKISERNIRLEKIKKLREKILQEIDQLLSSYKNELKIYNINMEDFEYSVEQCFSLFALKEYVIYENLFMGFEMEDKSQDTIIYVIPIENIDIWLMDDYDFVSQFLFNAKEYGYDVFRMLNEKYFAHNFINLIDQIARRKRLKENDK